MNVNANRVAALRRAYGRAPSPDRISKRLSTRMIDIFAGLRDYIPAIDRKLRIWE